MKFGEWFKAGFGVMFGMSVATAAIKSFSTIYEVYKKSKDETKTDSETEESTEEES